MTIWQQVTVSIFATSAILAMLSAIFLVGSVGSRYVSRRIVLGMLVLFLFTATVAVSAFDRIQSTDIMRYSP